MVTNRSQERGTSPLMQPKKKPPMQKPPTDSNINSDKNESRRQSSAKKDNSRSASKNKGLPPKGDSKSKNFRINSKRNLDGGGSRVMSARSASRRSVDTAVEPNYNQNRY